MTCNTVFPVKLHTLSCLLCQAERKRSLQAALQEMGALQQQLEMMKEMHKVRTELARLQQLKIDQEKEIKVCNTVRPPAVSSMSVYVSFSFSD